MRKLVWLMLFAVAALLGAQENAFAHAGHNHAPTVQSAAAAEFEIVFVENGEALYFDQFASAAQQGAAKCQHGKHELLCDECCGCSAHASVALNTPEHERTKYRTPARYLSSVSGFLLRFTTSDLTRPPKFFA